MADGWLPLQYLVAFCGYEVQEMMPDCGDVVCFCLPCLCVMYGLFFVPPFYTVLFALQE
jgi:hypothetical protein